MHSTKEIVEYYREHKEEDWGGFIFEVVGVFLSGDEAREFCKPDADLSDWPLEELSEERVLETMRDYMELAWDKARGHRGISADRSVQKMAAWLWILGDDEMVAFAEADDNYAQYGVPILKRISEKYGFPVPSGEDVERMSKGLPCVEGCQGGCGYEVGI